MFFHVYVFVLRDDGRPGRRGDAFFFLNLDEEQLRARVVDAWDRGQPMTWSGRTAESARAGNVRIFRTEGRVSDSTASVPGLETAGAEDVTNEWILGPAGRVRAAQSSAPDNQEAPAHRDRRRVMVVHGRNLRARDAMFNFLRAVGLSPIEWEEAVAETGVGSPHNLDAVRAAMEVAQAVVVMLTAEDRAGLLPELASDSDDDTHLRGQPRQNVILEAGLVMGVDRARVILVELGDIRRASDFEGLNVIRLSNATPSRIALRNRLQTAGCEVDEGTSDWARPEAGTDFEATVIQWTPMLVPNAPSN